ncbi:hypothetical protein NLI96_g9867 [Meripilus lineatus]|uniref:Uncharacterized protein n=1 Tax=Meripilus lineatus TaxID=2056292 RepID=A0AAD5YEW1_9APHY|nr:hypothetical protein NLI96_g9867 [Physisporinus lineatus]
MWHCKKDGFVMLRLLRDGGIFYLVVLGSIGFSTIGTLPGRSVVVSQPATNSGFILNVTSVAVARLMLSIQSLAAGLKVEPTWLLSHAELSRVRWRRGAHEAELIVEIDSAEAPDRMVELTSLGDLRTSTNQKGFHVSGDFSQLSTTV